MRASIARALVTRPAVLLMDEPFAALDEITRLKLNDDLLALKSALGATVVFVTHSVFESVYLSTRIVVIAARPGRAVAQIEVDAAAARCAEFRMSRRLRGKMPRDVRGAARGDGCAGRRANRRASKARANESARPRGNRAADLHPGARAGGLGRRGALLRDSPLHIAGAEPGHRDADQRLGHAVRARWS